MLTDEQKAWVSERTRVIVENPTNGAKWAGRALAIAAHPTILLETDDGGRDLLPLEWARTAPPTALVHLVPRLGSTVAPCCATEALELPLGDRITSDDVQVTCRGGKR